MARRRHHEEHENHERWLVSYADFITLLFAFFVVMYSISSINEGKYKILSETLVGVFNQPDRSIKPIPVGEERPRTPPQEPESESGIHETRALQDIAESMREALGELIDGGQVTVRGHETWVEIELSSALLFSSGDAIPANQAFGILEKVAKVLAPYRNPVRIEGFTDDRPIATAQFPSNWELSAARAASVVRMLIMNGVAPERLAAVGYGEFQPVADNSTAEGRARNRRVVLVVSRNLDVRREVGGMQEELAAGQGDSQAGMQPAPELSGAASPAEAVNSSSPL
ncbi:flagellar motor protein MotD [Zestomonas thermotolerans]|uniref:flagellar motor protein MotD n=1 Tax=Zestomonas thermotolerans TaxID=157784 RepID=UPI0003713C84|nr:flagellar motor protein MotD [Pseudomonas thermotolerans]MBO2511261.1 flagellar motor protein MotD [Gammaproteobacteria bacterium]